MNKRWVASIAVVAVALAVGVVAWTARQAPGPQVTVYKSPTCGCCKRWVSHLEDNGFDVKAVNVRNIVPIKKENGITRDIASCHTALVDGYVVEGHVPADVIHRLLREKPDVTGLAVPRMPVGSPGMEQGGRKDPYEVLTFDEKGEVTVYERR